MSDRYPHLEDTKYPDLQNSNVWAYQNNFDFEQFQNTQMHLKLISVPWDLGEVHVGLKIIPMGNVVGWNSKEERDTWLDAQQGIEWDTEYRSYHDESTIRLPVPYEYMAYYNYLVVDYEKPPVAHADGTGISRFLYFIRDLNQLSINATQCTLQLDSWSMFINDVDISYMMLERGHYAMSKAASVNTYLQRPIESTDYLLTPDVSFGTPGKSKEVGVINFETTAMYYVIASTANVYSTAWGSEKDGDWKTIPVTKKHTEQDSPSYFIFGFEATSDTINNFWSAINEQCPQFTQTVKAAYLISADLCQPQDYFQFCGIDVYTFKALNQQVEFGALTKDSFGYPEQYRELTKLYTSPYCYLEVTDGNGNDVRINIEDMGSDTVRAYRYLSIAYPYMSITAYLANVGSAAGEKEIKYQKVGQRNFKYSGKFWDAYWQMDIPTYAVMEGGYYRSKYVDWYNRDATEKQTKLNANNNYTISEQNAAVSRQMAKNNAQAAKESTDVQNGEDGVNDKNTKEANIQVDANSTNDRNYLEKTVDNNNYVTKNMANADSVATIQSASIAANASVQTAANEASAGQVNAAINGVAGVATGAVNGFASGGQLGAAAGAISGVVSGVAGVATATVSANMINTNASINAGATMSASNVAANLTTNKANMSTSKDTLNQLAADTSMEEKAKITKAYNTAVNTNNNAGAVAITKINTNVTSNNAQRQYITVMGGTADSLGNGYAASYTIDKGSAELAKDTSLKCLEYGLDANIKEKWLDAPIEHGYFTGGDYQSVKPNALWANVVTQPNDCIAQAGNEFLRYGYRWNGQCDFITFNVMPKFSYWKVSDIWMTAKNLPDAWVDVVRNILLHGITVWSKPEYINNTSIFDN